MHRIGYSLSTNRSYQIQKQPKGLLRKYFDLLRNSHSTVLVYADECELLVFGAFLNSPSACRKGFFDTLNTSYGAIFTDSIEKTSICCVLGKIVI